MISQENSELKRELLILKMYKKEKEMAKMVNELDDLKTDQMQHKTNSTYSCLSLKDLVLHVSIS